MVVPNLDPVLAAEPVFHDPAPSGGEGVGISFGHALGKLPVTPKDLTENLLPFGFVQSHSSRRFMKTLAGCESSQHAKPAMIAFVSRQLQFQGHGHLSQKTREALGVENRSWRYTRIQSALANLRHEVGRGTIAKLLREAGLDPPPDRRKGTTWKEFLRMHWSSMAAMDFFTVEVWTPRRLVLHHVLCVIRLMTREIQFTGIVPEPDQAWMKQMARNLTDECDGFLRGMRFLIHDRSTLFCEQFQEIVKSAGVQPLRLPARSPNLNAYAERFVRSVKESCVEQMIFFGQSSLRRALAEFESHYHTERNHQGLENKIIRPEFPELPKSGRVCCRSRLGGLLRYYHREAA